MGISLFITLWNKGVDPKTNAIELALLQEEQNAAIDDTLTFIDPGTMVYPQPRGLFDSIVFVAGVHKSIFLDGKELADNDKIMCNSGDESFTDFIRNYTNSPQMIRSRSIPLCDNASISALKDISLDAYRTLFIPDSVQIDRSNSKNGFFVPSADEVWFIKSDLTMRRSGSGLMPVSRAAIFQRIDGKWFLAFAPSSPDLFFCKSTPADLVTDYNQIINDSVQHPSSICNLRNDTFNFFIKRFNRSPNFRQTYTASYINLPDTPDHNIFSPQEGNPENGDVTKSFVRLLEDEVWYIARKEDNDTKGWGQLSIFKRINNHWYLVANFISE